MTPVAVLKFNPAGNVGEMENDETVPVTVGLNGEIAIPAVNMFGVLYVNEVGAASRTARFKTKDVAPPELEAVMV